MAGLLSGGRKGVLLGPELLFISYTANASKTMKILKPHVSLNVTNIDASVAFYERMFGVAASKRRPGYAKFDLESPALNLTMQERAPTGINASHFGVQVASSVDVQEAKSRFENSGLKIFTEEDVECCYALQDKVWVEDPDGNSWEVFVVKGDADAMSPRATQGDKAACCVPASKSAPNSCC